MNFRFLIAYKYSDGVDILSILHEILEDALVNNNNEYDVEDINHMIVPQQHRLGESITDQSGNTFQYILLSFTLEIPDETAYSQEVIKEFVSVLPDTSPILHVLKFEDPLLQKELSRLAEEIFHLEMKLRCVLSLIYLHSYQNEDPYSLLYEETVQPMAKERPKAEQMRVAAENQFFHLTFSQYINLNQRPEVKLPLLLENIRNIEQYEDFRAEILRLPVENEDDANLLAGLKERMDAIEAMRNCVAHNRQPARRVIENYDNARPILNQLLDIYLSRWA